MLWIVRVALQRSYMFGVLALFILIAGSLGFGACVGRRLEQRRHASATSRG